MNGSSNSTGQTSESAASQSPLLSVWQGPHGGLPPFQGVKADDFKPALEQGIELNRRDIEAITGRQTPPDFDNTIAALEGAGRALDRVLRVYSIWTGTLSSPAIQALEKEMAPRIAAFQDELMQNLPLFQRIETVYKSPELKKRSPEEQRLTWKYYSDFVRAGAKLDAGKKARLSAINQRLASLFTSFNQNLLGDEASHLLLAEKDLAGLSESHQSSLKAAAKALGFPDQYAVNNTRSSVEPFLVYSEREDLREKVWTRFMGRGANGDAHDNFAAIKEILKLRAERATLLGYETHAHWRLEKEMAKTPDQALALMKKVWKPAVARVHEEVEEMLKLAVQENPAKTEIKPWDYRFYAEKVRRLKYDVDESEIKPYFQLEGLREGMFWVAGELFGFDFILDPSIAVVHPDVRVWEVKDRASGQHVGLWYFDPYARPGKRSGAWMSSYRRQEKYRGVVTTIVSNNSNFVRGAPDAPILISLHDAKTLFHEFGHALHGLSSNVNYPSLAGTMVPRDFVEFPSQLFEDWLLTPEVLNRFALHVETKAPMPASLVTKIKKAATFNQGFETLEFLASAIVDMSYHLSKDEITDPNAFEAQVLKELGMPKEMVMRHRSPQFAHIFGSDGYSAGYYSYLWADTLSASTFEAFTEAKGPYDKEVAARLRKHVLSVGNSIDPEESFRAFRGRDPDSDALMRKRGFPLHS